MGELFKVLALAHRRRWRPAGIPARRLRAGRLLGETRAASRRNAGTALDTPIASQQPGTGQPARAPRALPPAPRRGGRSRPPASARCASTWREFERATSTAGRSALAALGVARGDRVGDGARNSLALLATYWACAKLGAAIVPLSPLLDAPPGSRRCIADATPRVVLTTSRATRCDARRRRGRGVAAQPDRVGAGRRRAGRRGGGLALRSRRCARRRRPRPPAAARRGRRPRWTCWCTRAATTGLPKGILHTHFIRAMYATD
ncbi:MAG: AMP-binding protein [Comamonadaceae bacterium]|nr:AMP-binding protein [Comamonadaceae bacterium]